MILTEPEADKVTQLSQSLSKMNSAPISGMQHPPPGADGEWQGFDNVELSFVPLWGRVNLPIAPPSPIPLPGQ